MDFKMYNVGRSQVNANFIPQAPDIYGAYLTKDETPQYNNDSDEGVRVQPTFSGKTYSANSKSTLKNPRVFTPNTYGNNDQDDTRQNIHNFNFNTAVSENYEFTNMPETSKQQYIQSGFQHQEEFEQFNGTGVKTFCAANTYSSEGNDHRKYTEKSTYCRAFFNNQEFVYRTLAKNARLQRLVKKLVLVRQKQKDKDLWNNYINELKNRHGYTRTTGTIRLQHVEEMPPERIEDYYETRQLDPCQNLLKDFYTVHNNFNRNLQFKAQEYSYQPVQDNYRPYVFENQSLCYPTASQGRLMMLNKERQENQFFNNNYPRHRNYYGNTIFIDKDCSKPRKKQSLRKPLSTKSTNTMNLQNPMAQKYLYNKSIQTDFRSLLPISEVEKDNARAESAKERYKQVAKNVEKLKRKLEKSNSEMKQSALDNIENKLNNLIQTLNTFMVDIKSNNPFSRSNKSVSVSGRVKDNSLNELNTAKSDIFGVIKREQAICRIAHENHSATSGFLDACSSKKCKNDKYMKIDKILNEELDKSNKVKKDIEDIMYKRTHCPRAVQITFDIPTKERSTEVTASLPITKFNNIDNIEEIRNSVNITDDRRMTIAVNTDPLGLLGLLRISSEAVKQMLSYMPQIDYYSYLAMLQFPQARNGVPHYICNICGASFERPSQLSDHIQTHNLGYSRDCCVCRHVLDMKRHRPGLFKCKHCGQRFTRAYCCELHEETCARRLGVPHDVSSRLNILQ